LISRQRLSVHHGELRGRPVRRWPVP